MTESSGAQPEQVAPAEFQRPPIFGDDEADAVLRAQSEIAAARLGSEGEVVFHQYLMGATYDGMVVSVDERSGLTDDHFVVRVGPVSRLVEGDLLAEDRLPYGTPKALRFSDGGTTMLRSTLGSIHTFPSDEGRLPRFNGKILFPIGQDGRPFSPTDRPGEAKAVSVEEAERTPSASWSARLGIAALRDLLRRRR